MLLALVLFLTLFITLSLLLLLVSGSRSKESKQALARLESLSSGSHDLRRDEEPLLFLWSSDCEELFELIDKEEPLLVGGLRIEDLLQAARRRLARAKRTHDHVALALQSWQHACRHN